MPFRYLTRHAIFIAIFADDDFDDSYAIIFFADAAAIIADDAAQRYAMPPRLFISLRELLTPCRYYAMPCDIIALLTPDAAMFIRRYVRCRRLFDRFLFIDILRY